MLSYQHEYHAGNHADVLKHIVLTLLIEALQRKPSPLRVIDTHAGSGGYDLTSPAAQHGREYERGIARVLAADDPLPELASYLAAVKSLNRAGPLQHYPGSPQIARNLLRPQDHLELFELHPQAFDALAATFGRDAQTHMHHRDAFEGVAAVLPPLERRGIVLIDPSYELGSDFANVLSALSRGHRRWSNGVIAVWYPIVHKPGTDTFLRRLENLPMPGVFDARLEVAAPRVEGLRGSGLVILNLPFGVDEQLRRVLPWLHRHLAPEGTGRWRAHWLRNQSSP